MAENNFFEKEKPVPLDTESLSNDAHPPEREHGNNLHRQLKNRHIAMIRFVFLSPLPSSNTHSCPVSVVSSGQV